MSTTRILPVFLYRPTQTYYYLAASRWFGARELAGPWTFASMNLPPDFANVPLSSPASAIAFLLCRVSF